MNTPKNLTGGCCPPPPCSALAGTFDIEAIEQAFFNHDHDGAEPALGQWEKRRDQWRSFKTYLANHPRQEISGRDAYKEEINDKIRRGEPVGIMDALAAIEYQHQRKQQEPPSLWKRVIRFFLPNDLAHTQKGRERGPDNTKD